MARRIADFPHDPCFEQDVQAQYTVALLTRCGPCASCSASSSALKWPGRLQTATNTMCLVVVTQQSEPSRKDAKVSQAAAAASTFPPPPALTGHGILPLVLRRFPFEIASHKVIHRHLTTHTAKCKNNSLNSLI